MKALKISLLLLNLLAARLSFAQTNIHLHCNKDSYMAGESVWFSAYLSDSLSGRLQQNTEPLFVEFFAPDGKRTDGQIVFTQNGRGFGALKLSQNLSGGVYRLRAFRKTNFPAGYEKQLIVKNIKDETLAYIPPHPARQSAWPQPLKINVGVEKYFFSPRQQINVKISVKDAQNQPVKGTFSMSVSELMTVGTQDESSILNEIVLGKDSIQPKKTDVGLTYQGRVIDEKTGVGIGGANVVVMATSSENHFSRAVTTDGNGDFNIDNVPIIGQQEVSYQINDKKGFQIKGAMVAWRNFPPDYDLPVLSNEQVAMTETQKEQQFQNIQQPDGELYAKTSDKSIQLSEVKIKEKRAEETDTRGLIKLHSNYSFARDFDPSKPMNVSVEMMASMVGGMSLTTVGGRDVLMMNGTFGSPLILVDGVPFNSLPNGNDVVRIEVIRGADAVIYGSAASNGVVYVYTRRFGDMKYYGEGKSKIGTLKGYELPKLFYFPDYSQANNKEPDNRLTLYWNPDITTDANGEAIVSFYASDTIGNFKIMVEGMSTNNAGMATKLIRVDLKK